MMVYDGDGETEGGHQLDNGIYVLVTQIPN